MIKTPTKHIQLMFLILAVMSIITFILLNLLEIIGHSAAQHSAYKDFYVFYTASNLLKNSHLPDIFNPELFRHQLELFKGNSNVSYWLYPPNFLPYIAWLSYLSYYQAFISWSFAQIFLFILGRLQIPL